MKKRKTPKFSFEIESYGEYTKWERGSKELPKIRKFTTEIKAEEDVEFGCIVRFKKAKGALIQYTIKHPKLRDSKGKIADDFVGEQYINANDYRFFIGDKIWLPLEDKRGTWEIFVRVEDQLLVQKKFLVV